MSIVFCQFAYQLSANKKSSKGAWQVRAQRSLLFLQMFRLRGVLWSTGNPRALFALVCCYSLLIV